MGSLERTQMFRFRGLQTSANSVSGVEAGAAEVADNVVYLGTDSVGPRRGFTATASVPNGAGVISRLTSFAGSTLVFPTSGKSKPADGLGGGGGFFAYKNGTWTTFEQIIDAVTLGWPVILPPDASNPIRFAQAKRNIYFTTSSGVRKADTLVAGRYGYPMGGYSAGILAPLISGTVTTGVSGADWLPNGSSVAYRVVFGRYDENNNLVLSPPSNPILLTNSTGSAGTPSVTFYSPGFTNTGFWNPDTPLTSWAFLYRSVSATTSSAVIDEMFLVNQVAANDTGTISDTTTDAFLQMNEYPLYTNANTGEGQEHAKEPPPLARDIAWNANARRMFYVNTTSRQRLALTLLGVGAPNGLQAGDVITIGNVGFTAVTSGADYRFRTFLLTTSGSAAQNIEATARALSLAVSRYFGSLDSLTTASTGRSVLRMTYESGLNDPPGLLELEEITIGGPSVALSASAHGATAWNPPIDTAVNTTADSIPGRFYYSEPDEPEAVPLDNFDDVGAADQPIQRVVVTQDATYFFKADGLFKLVGDDPSNWQIYPVDSTAILQAPESAVASKSAVFAMLTKGPSVVTSTGVQPIDSAIDQDFRTLRAQEASTISTNGWGVVYATEGRYILGLPVAPGDTGSSQQYVYDVKQNGWTHWTVANPVHGIIDPATDKLVLAVGDKLWIENKTYTSLDMNDNGASIDAKVKFQPITADGSSLTVENYRDIYFAFQRAEFSSCTVGIESNTQPIATNYTQPGATPATWGSFSWGSVPWGAPVRNYVVHQEVPALYQQSTLLGLTFETNQANVNWILQGVAVLYEETNAQPK